MARHSIERIMKTTGLALAGFVAISTPLISAGIGYRATVAHQRDLARVGAEKAARYIFQHEPYWVYQTERMREVVQLHAVEENRYAQSVVAASGAVVLADTLPLNWPVLQVSEPIQVLGRVVGEIEVRSSLRGLVVETGITALLSLGAAVVTYALFIAVPMRRIDRAVAAMAEARKRAEDAYEELRIVDAELLMRTEQLQTAQELGRIGDWRMQVGTSQLILSPVARKLLQIDGVWFEPTLADFKARVLGDGGDAIDRMMTDVLRLRRDQTVDVDFCRGDDRVVRLALTCHVGTEDDAGEVTGTIQDLSERYEAQIQLEKLAFFDPLTGLANRAMFNRRLIDVCEQVERTGRPATLMLIDLDRFKEVNDSLGHGAGDELLTLVARQLNTLVRGPHVIARLGGDEFGIMLLDGCARPAVEHLAQTIIETLGQPLKLTTGEAQVGASIGIVRLPQDGVRPEDINKHADLALYRAKERGRGRFAWFEPAMSEVFNEKLALARDLRAALSHDDDLEVWFQPQVSLKSDRVVGFEALARWYHAERGFVPPSDFIAVAESSSLISEIGQWMFLNSARSAMAWRGAGHPAFEIAVNLSAAQVWQTDVERDIANVLEKTGLPPSQLCLELTESILADHTEGRVRRTLFGLKGLGVRLALDDFGTGYSSLGYLVQLPFDKLKIDRSFIAGATTSIKKQRVLEGIVSLGHGIGMEVIAEGIETGEELALVRAVGGDQVQGYLIARPAPAERAIAFATTWNARAEMAA